MSIPTVYQPRSVPSLLLLPCSSYVINLNQFWVPVSANNIPNSVSCSSPWYHTDPFFFIYNFFARHTCSEPVNRCPYICASRVFNPTFHPPMISSFVILFSCWYCNFFPAFIKIWSYNISSLNGYTTRYVPYSPYTTLHHTCFCWIVLFSLSCTMLVNKCAYLCLESTPSPIYHSIIISADVDLFLCWWRVVPFLWRVHYCSCLSTMMLS